MHVEQNPPAVKKHLFSVTLGVLQQKKTFSMMKIKVYLDLISSLLADTVVVLPFRGLGVRFVRIK